jgi:hypothetical protein
MSMIASKEDFEHYNTQGEAHKEPKAFASCVRWGNLTAYF